MTRVDQPAPALDCWGLLELMGHRRMAGRLSEQVVAGAGFVRIDVPATSHGEAYSRLFGASAIYCITPTSEQVAMALAEHLRHEPIAPYEIAKLRPPRLLDEYQEFETEDGDDDEDLR